MEPDTVQFRSDICYVHFFWLMAITGVWSDLIRRHCGTVMFSVYDRTVQMLWKDSGTTPKESSNWQRRQSNGKLKLKCDGIMVAVRLQVKVRGHRTELLSKSCTPCSATQKRLHYGFVALYKCYLPLPSYSQAPGTKKMLVLLSSEKCSVS